MWRTHGTKGYIVEEGFFRHQRNKVADHIHRLVRDVFGHMVALLGHCGHGHKMIIAGQFEVKLIGFALQQTIVSVKALLQRPIGI